MDLEIPPFVIQGTPEPERQGASMLNFRILTATLLLAFATGASGEEGKRTLPTKHAKVGVLCQDCHKKENPSKAAVADESCMVCHGDYPAMAAYTKHLKPNPHQPPADKHPDPIACPECHRQHKAPVVKCLECHPTFKMSAPR